MLWWSACIQFRNTCITQAVHDGHESTITICIIAIKLSVLFPHYRVHCTNFLEQLTKSAFIRRITRSPNDSICLQCQSKFYIFKCIQQTLFTKKWPQNFDMVQKTLEVEQEKVTVQRTQNRLFKLFGTGELHQPTFAMGSTTSHKLSASSLCGIVTLPHPIHILIFLLTLRAHR